MTFDEWWEKPTDGWYLGRMATDDEKRYAHVAWEEATKAEREACAKTCAKTCEDEAKAIRREGEGSTNAQYDWMAYGAERCAEALRSNVEVQGPGAASSRTVPCNDGLAGTVLPRLTFDQERTVSNCKGECVNRDKVKPGFEINDCPNMKEVEGDLSMDSEHYKCDVCGKRYYLDYEEMK